MPEAAGRDHPERRPRGGNGGPPNGQNGQPPTGTNRRPPSGQGASERRPARRSSRSCARRCRSAASTFRGAPAERAAAAGPGHDDRERELTWRRRPALTTLALAALAAAAVVGAVVVVGSPAATSAQERTVTVARGVIQSTVSGSGNLEPANEADVDFATSGEITHIYVKAGQHVARTSCWRRSTRTPPTSRSPRPRPSLQSAQDALDTAETRDRDGEHRDGGQRVEGLGLELELELERDEHHDRRRRAGQPRQRAAQRHERREGRRRDHPARPHGRARSPRSTARSARR